MASKSGAGLIVAGLLVLLFGFLFFDIIIDSEEDSRDACDAANVGDSAENETCDSKDRKFIGFQTLMYILLVFLIAGLLVWAGARKLAN